MGNIKALDCTLRDGGYINQWKFGKDTIKGILERLSQAEMDIIECGFLTELVKGEDYSLYKNANVIDAYIENPNPNILYVAMIAIGEKEIHPDLLVDAKETVIGGIRLTFHKKEIKKAFEWAGILKRKGYKVFMQPVGSANYEDYSLLELVKKINHFKPYAFYIVDTLGGMSVKDMIHMMHMLDKNLEEGIALGYHAHNNQQLAFANAQKMVEFGFQRDIFIDCSVYGMGRGAGNLCSELLLPYLNQNANKQYDVLPILEIVDNYLMPIYVQYPWGYSVAYFLASFFQCHPNYVSYLISKQNMQMRTIRSLLKQIPKEYRLTYHKDLVEDIYKTYQNNAIDDKELIGKLKKEWKGKHILMLAPGKSLHSRKKEIEEYQLKKKCYTIAINFMPETKVDMIFIANQKRFEALPKDVDLSNFIFSSNIKGLPEGANVVSYSELLNAGQEIYDSSGLMLLKLLIRAKVKQVSIAGMDGFRKNHVDNYCDKRFYYQNLQCETKKKNQQMKEQIKMFRKEIGMKFITPSKYDEK